MSERPWIPGPALTRRYLRVVQPEPQLCMQTHTAPSGKVFICVSRLHSVINGVGHYFVAQDGDHPCLRSSSG